MCPKKIIFNVEGNIGSGKTTLLEAISKLTDEFSIEPEPLFKWQNMSGVNLLQLMYSDKKTWALPFQLYVGKTFMDRIVEADKEKCLFERSIMSAKKIFIPQNINQGDMTREMGLLFNEIFPDEENDYKYIYVRTNPTVAHQRIAKRGREEEKGISLKFIEGIHNLHEEWLFNNPDVIIVEADGQIDYNIVLQKIVETINE